MAGFKILDITLHQFLGFIKPRIETITVNFVEMVQILNSTNGSGKTEFLKETSPFPINKDIFTKEGYKTIRIDKDGIIYCLHSTHKKNSFVIESTGEELNRGGTISTQEELIQEHLGVSRVIWGMITGRSKFTQMDKNARRQWMEVISGLDFDYAFKVYKDIKTAISHHKGSVKVTSDHLLSETAKQLESVELDQLTTEHVELNHLISDILKNGVGDSDSSIHECNERVKCNELAFKNKLKEYLDLKSRKKRVWSPLDKPMSIDEIKLELQRIKDALTTNNKQIDNLTLELAELNELKDKLIRTDGYTLSTITTALNELKRQEEKIIKEVGDDVLMDIISGWSSEDVESGIVYMQELQNVLHDVFMDWSEDIIALPFSLEDYKRYKKNQDELRSRISKGHSVVNRCELKLKHYLECENTSCPKCEHEFKVGLENVTEKDLRDKLKDSELLLNSLILDEKEVTTKIGEYDKCHSFIELVKNRIVALDNPFLKYFKNITFDSIVKSKLLDMVDGIVRYRGSLTTYVDLIKKKQQFNTVMVELQSQEKLINLDQLTTKHKSLLTKLNDERISKDRYLQCGSDLKEYGTYLSKLNMVKSEVLSIGKDLQQSRSELITALGGTIQNEIITTSQTRMATLNKILSEQKTLDAAIESMQRQIDSSNKKLNYLQSIEKALNPSVGVIAKQMGGYAEQFTKQLSDIVGKLWGYSLEILPPRIDGVKGMDYKFPFIIEGNTESPIPDISGGSTATISGFNLGIMLSTRIALGMEQMPLFMDEVSHGFDVLHTERLGEFLKTLLNDYQCSNLFFVDHEVGMREVLGQHDMIVFDASQVVINGEYNKNVTIEYLS